MPDRAGNEYAGLSAAQQKTLKEFIEARKDSIEAHRGTWEKMVRMYRLFAGILPPELDGVFSKIMLWFPYSIVQRELATTMRSMLTGKDWFSIKARTMDLDTKAKAAQFWLKWQLETIQQFQRTAIPSLQSMIVMGDGYRFYGCTNVDETVQEQQTIPGPVGTVAGIEEVEVTRQKKVITGQFTNVFNVLPAPEGHLINPPVDTMEAGLPYLIVQTFPDKKWIEAEADKGNFDMGQVRALFDNKTVCSHTDDMTEYKSAIEATDGKSGWSNFNTPSWRSDMGVRHGTGPRYNVSWFFRRDKWALIAEHQYVLYDGPPLEDFWPIAHFKQSYNMEQFFGHSLIEPVEDLLISMALNLNMRFDYMAGIFHPPRYIPQQMVDDMGGDLSAFDWEPYKVIPYQHQAFPNGPAQFLHTEQMPQLPQQVFLEQNTLQEYLQSIISQHGVAQLDSNTATGAALLSATDTAPQLLRAITAEVTGFQDCIELTLKFGKKYKTEDEIIRTDEPGLPFRNIDHTAIIDGYDVTVTGMRDMIDAENMFKKQLSLAPSLIGNPAVRGQEEMIGQMVGQAFDRPDVIMNGSGNEVPNMGATPSMPGGAPSLQNDTRSVDNNNASQQIGALTGAI